jgi:hypothetical protein
MVEQAIKRYINTLPEGKRNDIEALHQIIISLHPTGRLWFLDGKNEENKTVANPNIGYGLQTITYTDGKKKEFYQVGITATTTGISVYILGIADKSYLVKEYSKRIGTANVTGYCIRFKKLKDVDITVLQEALRDGFAMNGANGI